MSITPSQDHFLALYNEQHRPKFNEELFKRDDNKIIDELLKILFSCQRDQNNFTFLIKEYQVVDDYETIQKICYEYEESMRKGKNKKKINRFDFIDLKPTDMKLIVVVYHVKTTDEETDITIYIQVPRVVNKYYFRIAGNLYSAVYQIVDGSTYNSATSKNSKSDNICFKIPFMPIRMYKSAYSLKTTQGEEIPILNYSIGTFNKLFSPFKYILAKFGLYETFKFLNIHVITISKEVPQDDKLYTFKTNNQGIFVSVPKFIFDGEVVVQSLVCGICLTINKNTKYERIFDDAYWLEMLGMEFGQASTTKGEALLASLEGIYDISTKEKLHLPEEHKGDIYRVIRWMIYEYPSLSSKDNLDISTKRVEYAPYIASLYAMKMANIIHSMTDMAAKNKLKMDTVKKKMRGLKPSFLLDALTKCQLIVYRNLVNDMDAFTALKFTYKRLSGTGNNSSASVPAIYKTVHPSQIGRVDMDSSSKSDPGLSGILCPMVELYDDSFSEYEEPITWEDKFNKLMTEYESLSGLQQVYTARQTLLGENNKETISSIQCSLDIMKTLMNPIYAVECSSDYMVEPLEDSGLIFYERGYRNE